MRLRVWDWQREEAYAYTRDYNLHEWAWEFLRRNAAYREAYVEFEEELKTLRERTPGDPQEDSEYFALAFYVNNLHEAASYPWGIDFPADPTMPAKAVNLRWTHQAGVGTLTTWRAPEPPPGTVAWPWPGYPRNIALSFDFLYPIETQIDIAAERLRACSRYVDEHSDLAPIPMPNASRYRPSQFVLYLRLLDAKLDEASTYRIARVLFGDKADSERSARKALETARQMANWGYRELLLLPPSPEQTRNRLFPPE